MKVGEKGAAVIRSLHRIRDLREEFTEEERRLMRSVDAKINAQKA